MSDNDNFEAVILGDRQTRLRVLSLATRMKALGSADIACFVLFSTGLTGAWPKRLTEMERWVDGHVPCDHR